MKKFMRTAAMMLAATMMLSLTVFAAAPQVKEKNGYEVSAQVDATGSKLTSLTLTDGAIEEDGQYMIFVVDGDLPTVDSILYINQKQADEDGEITFENVYPKEMKNSNVMVSGTGFKAPVTIAEIVVGTEPTPDPEPDVMLGDVNGDELITAADAQEIQRYAASLSSALDEMATDEMLAVADINGDGIITAADAQEIQRYAASLSSALDK